MVKTILFLFTLLGLIPLIVSACLSQPVAPTPIPAETVDTSQLANPASVYCEANGGKVEIRTEADGGQFGMCLFANGSECDEWAYLRGECQPGANLTAPVTLAIPAFVNEKYGFSFDPPPDYAIEGLVLWEHSQERSR